MITFIKRKQLPESEIKQLEKAVQKYMAQVSQQIRQIEELERKVLK